LGLLIFKMDTYSQRTREPEESAQVQCPERSQASAWDAIPAWRFFLSSHTSLQ